MKLAFCLFKYFPWGGMEQNLIRILKECQQRNHSIDIYAMKWEGEKPKNVRLFLVPYRGWTNHTQCLSFATHLQPLLASQHYDAIIGFNRMPGLDIYEAADVCYEQKARNQHHFLYRCLPRYKVFSFLERSVFSSEAKTHILLLSEKEKMNYKRYYGTQDNRFHLLPPGISKKYKPTADTEKTRQEIRQVLKISNDEQVILFIGSGFYGKGLDRLLYALAQLPSEIKNKTKVWITGKGRQWFYQVKAYCLGIKNQIQFLGLRQDVPQLLTGGDILVHPARNEAGGMVILEAIINGLPTIASAECGFAPHIKKAQAGIVLSEPFKQIELNAALLHLLTLSNEQRNQLKQNGLHYGKIADLYNRIEQIVDFIESRKFKNL